MGQLRYGDSTVITIDDDTLAHFQLVILGRLRIHQSLVLPWTDTTTGVRMTLWLHPQSDLVFLYDNPVPPRIDKTRLHALKTHVDDTGTLRLPVPITSPLTGSAVSATVGGEQLLASQTGSGKP